LEANLDLDVLWLVAEWLIVCVSRFFQHNNNNKEQNNKEKNNNEGQTSSQKRERNGIKWYKKWYKKK